MAHRKKEDLIAQDKRFLWHPFTQMADWANDDPSRPLVIGSGRGVYLFDREGNRYIDGVSSLWVTVHGHRKKEIDQAIRKQLKKIAHSTFLGLTHEPAIRLAKELLDIAPRFFSRVFYSDNGSTSVEVALKMAFQYWSRRDPKRNTFLSLVNAYHGDTIGSVSVGGMGLFHAAFKPLLFKAHFAPSPYCYRCPRRENRSPVTLTAQPTTFEAHCRSLHCQGECLAETEKILKKHHRRIAAAVVEPLVQGAAGMITMPPGYLKGFERLCRKYGILLIADEVATGFGRTGTMFAVEQEKIQPDFLCLSKGITGGYLPLAATLTTEKIYRAFLGKYEKFKSFFHGHTYTANPLACAAALANIEVFTKEKVLAALPRKIARLRRELSVLEELPFVGEIRQRGLMAGIELVKDKTSGTDFETAEKIGARVCAACRPQGLILRPLGNVIVMMPPLSITGREITRMAAIVRGAILKTII